MSVAQQIYHSMTRFNNNFALIDADRVLTYRQLFNVVRNIDQRLTKGEPVGIYIEPSVLFAVASVACLLKGCPIVPIDTALPDSAVQNIVDELELNVIFVSDNLQEFPCKHVRLIDTKAALKFRNHPYAHMELAEVQDVDAIYVVSTSGTTGKPKCIPVVHSAASLSYSWREQLLPYRPNQRVGIHIFAIWELFRPLIRGACCVFPGRENMASVEKLAQFLSAYKIDEMLFTPSFIENFCDISSVSKHAEYRFPKRIILNGEPVKKELIKKIANVFSTPDIWNLFSISETHDISIEKLDVELMKDSDSYVVGSPMPHLKAYVLNNMGLPVNAETEGELYLEGEQMLGPGYINRPEETKKRFIELNIDGISRKLYKTGDRGVMMRSGKLKIIGRSEHMLKLRGFSIQTEDLVESLRTIISFDQAIPWIQKHNNRDKLVFYYTAATEQKNNNASNWGINANQWSIKDSLRRKLSRLLPEYCIPEIFIELEYIPLHAVSGKCNFHELPVPVPGLLTRGKHAVLSSLDSVNAMQQLWANILNVPSSSINIKESFRQNGGDSITQMELAHKCFEYWKHEPYYEQLSNMSCEALHALVTGNSASREYVNSDLPKRKGILLTGVTGYVGRHVLMALQPLLNKSFCVYCIVRPKYDSAHSRLKTLVPGDLENVYAIEGDLALEKFGVSEETYNQLLENTECVVHCASLVNLVLSEAMLNNDVINASKEVISFCKKANAVLHFTSTSAIAPSHGGPYEESTFIQSRAETSYGKTKVLVENEIVDSNIKYSIYRLPSLFCSDEPNESDIYTGVLQIIKESKKIPERLCFQLANIREIAIFMAHSAFKKHEHGYLNLMSNLFISVKNYQFHLEHSGYEVVSPAHWIESLADTNIYKKTLVINPNILLDTAEFSNRRAQIAWDQVMEKPFTSIAVPFVDWFGSIDEMSNHEFKKNACERSRLSETV